MRWRQSRLTQRFASRRRPAAWHSSSSALHELAAPPPPAAAWLRALQPPPQHEGHGSRHATPRLHLHASGFRVQGLGFRADARSPQQTHARTHTRSHANTHELVHAQTHTHAHLRAAGDLHTTCPPTVNSIRIATQRVNHVSATKCFPAHTHMHARVRAPICRGETAPEYSQQV